jgi:AraC-like DNA-binding protein
MKEVGLESERNTAHKCSPENNQNIIAEMETNAYYLNPELTIHVFAREIQISARLVSSCVNRNIGVNFNEWVNNYRVDKALHTIKSDDRNLLSIEGIGMEAGFKSRSAMYAAFRKKTGHSPGYYRNN